MGCGSGQGLADDTAVEMGSHRPFLCRIVRDDEVGLYLIDSDRTWPDPEIRPDVGSMAQEAGP
jgi:hypothetical protein